ncbi:hypothetical protein H5T53_06940 [Candidatus Bipolaricaulota bacterium]|nr:hypothetical protein [Candidatus Bipolaricaulota bacterium]
MRRVFLVGLVMFLVGCSALAESRWVVDLKSGAGAGLIGLATELEWSGFSVWVAAGATMEAVGYGIGLRFYFSPEAKSRGFAGPIVGAAGTEELALPYVGGTGGYEWRLTPNIRITIEAGIGFVLFIPLPILGLAVGWVF